MESGIELERFGRAAEALWLAAERQTVGPLVGQPRERNMEASGAIHHIDITVRDLGRSTAFYDQVLPLIGFRRSANVPEGPIWAGACLELGLQAARSPAAHDRYSPGLHHLAFTAPSRSAVNAFHERLLQLGLRVLDAPAEYPEYAPGYYAVFFADPDGIKLEYVFTPWWPT